MQLRQRKLEENNINTKRKRKELEESKDSETSAQSSEENYELSVISHFTLKEKKNVKCSDKRF